MNGDISRFAVAEETSYKVLPGSPNWKRLEPSEEEVATDYGYEDIETIKGSRVKSPSVRTRREISGSFSTPLAPENACAQLLKWACGKVTTFAGAFKRERIIAAGGETVLNMTHFPATSGSLKLYKNRLKMTLTVDYSVDYLTGEITLVAPLVAGDEMWLEYAKVAAGAYSHVIESDTTQKSFTYYNEKAGVDIFEYPGMKIDTLTIEISSEGVITVSCDIMAGDELLGSEQVPPTTFPSALLSQLDKFIFNQGKIRRNWVDDPNYESVTIEVSNGLEGRYTISCSDSPNKITEAAQSVALTASLEFNTTDEFKAVRDGDYNVFEVIFGQCNGIEIGTSGENYQFMAFFPYARFESNSTPTSVGTVVQELEGNGWYDPIYQGGYQFVFVNGETSI